MLSKVLAALAAVVMSCPAFADGPWLFEFEFGVPVESSSSRLVRSSCSKVVPVDLVQWYAIDPRPGWEVSCGNDRPVYHHFLGRRIGRPLPQLVLEFGWRHFSSPGDHNEIEYDAVAVRGRFTWGRR